MDNVKVKLDTLLCRVRCCRSGPLHRKGLAPSRGNHGFGASTGWKSPLTSMGRKFHKYSGLRACAGIEVWREENELRSS